MALTSRGMRCATFAPSEAKRHSRSRSCSRLTRRSGSSSTRELIEAEAQQHCYVLVPEPAQDKGDLITGRWAIQRFIVRAHGRPAHAGATLGAGRSAVREIAQQIVRIEEMSDPERHVTLSVGLVSGGTFVNVVPSDCRAEV